MEKIVVNTMLFMVFLYRFSSSGYSSVSKPYWKTIFFVTLKVTGFWPFYTKYLVEQALILKKL